ncbi:MAG TPA: permease prefix domain 1-containing protein, partial [Caulifigura sp.]|nr:permease prefix domain 1-containing protein [Caulifigura sp.]
MAEHEFERFLAVLSKLLKLSSKETAAVADEICDHLEERYSELVRIGIARDDAVKQALDEFEDAGEFAAKLNQLVRQRTRRQIMTGAFSTAAASALAILATTAFWPDQRPGGATAVPAIAQDAGAKKGHADRDDVTCIDRARYLPESLRKPVELDLHDVELSAFAKYVQEQSGFPVIIDGVELKDAGVRPDQKLTMKTYQQPLCLVLDRLLGDVDGTELSWRLDGDVIEITTREKADTLSEAFTVDVSELLDSGMSMQDVINVIQMHSSGPWEDIDGDGGKIRPLGTRLTFAQTHNGQFEILSILEGLKTPGRRIAVDQPEANRRIAEGLSARVKGEFHEQPLVDVVEEFGRQVDIPIVLDATALRESGVGTDAAVSLSMPANSLERILKVLLRDVGGAELTAVPKDGVLLITTRDKADSIQNVEIFDVSDLASQNDMTDVVNLMQQEATGPWLDIDGDGGAITPLPKQRVIVRQTRRGLDLIQRLLNDHRRAQRGPPPPPPPP